MKRIIMSPKWGEVQHSLARALDISIAIMEPKGKLLAIYNKMPFMNKLSSYPELSGLMEGFIFKLMRLIKIKGENEVVEDPLGFLVVPISLEGELFLVLYGGLNKEKKLCHQHLQSRLKAYGVTDAESFAKIRTVSPEELRKKAESIDTIYRWLTRSRGKTGAPDERITLLAAIDGINKLLAMLLCSEHFALNRILELVASSLMILCDAEGAWSFTLGGAGSTTVYKGAGQEAFLRELEDNWQTAVNQGEDPVNALRKRSTFGENVLRYPEIAKVSIQKGDSLICLGVVNFGNKYVKLALSSLARQSLLSLEIFLLYKLLQQQLGTLLNSVRHGIIVTNEKGQLMMINRAASNILSGYGLTFSLGKRFGKLGCPSMDQAVRKTISGGDSFLQKKSVLGKGKNLSYISWDVTPLRHDNVIIGAVLIIEDITENESLRSLREDWERLTTASEVAAGIAHEIRNPLSTVGAAIQLMERVDTEDRRKDLLGKINAELERMNKILTDFLNLSKSKSNLVLEQVDLVQLIEEMEFLFKSEAYLHNVNLTINCDFPQGFPPVMGKISGLKQVFLNIVKNAVEALSGKTVSEGRQLRISLQQDANYARVSFEDNGPGISPEYLKIIHRPFFSTKKSGTGLGLAISSSIIKKMGGELRFESEPGRGTVVHILLPIIMGS